MKTATSSTSVFSRGDVVWVKYGRWPRWPSLVLNYNSKSKKLFYTFLPLKTIPYKPSNKDRYKCQPKMAQDYSECYLQNTAKQCQFSKGTREEFGRAMEQANKIIAKKLSPFHEGCKLEPKDPEAVGKSQQGDSIETEAGVSSKEAIPPKMSVDEQQFTQICPENREERKQTAHPLAGPSCYESISPAGSTKGDRWTRSPEADARCLPTLSEVSDRSEQILAKGDVVWVKYRKWAPWPSLVLQHNKKTKKIVYTFLPIKIPFKPSHKTRFKCSSTAAQGFMENYHVHYTVSNQKDLEFLDAIEQANSIITKKIDPFSSVQVRADVMKEEAPPPLAVSENGPEAPTCCQALTAEEVGAGESSSQSSEESMDADEKRPESDDETESMTSEESDHDSDLTSQDSPVSRRRQRRKKNEDVMERIKSEETRQFLRQVYLNQVPNGRQTLWENHPGGQQMSVPASFGPVVDEDQVEELVQLLSIWFQEINPEASVRNTFSYIVCVWLPEAVKFVLQKYFGYSETQAEETLQEPPHYPRKEVRAVREEMRPQNSSSLSSGSPFDQLVAAACQQRHEDTASSLI